LCGTEAVLNIYIASFTNCHFQIRLPKEKNTINYPLHYILKTIEAWEALLDTGSKYTQASLPMTTASPSVDKLLMDTANQLQAHRQDPLQGVKKQAALAIQDSGA
ncbi:hypothetical protein AaE_001336, partial [Aphanomyces astaci]